MKYTDIFCIIILIIILLVIFWNKKQENFEVYNILKSKQIDNDIVDSKFTRDQEKLLTEYSFYVNDQIPTPKTVIVTNTVELPCTQPPCPTCPIYTAGTPTAGNETVNTFAPDNENVDTSETDYENVDTSETDYENVDTSEANYETVDTSTENNTNTNITTPSANTVVTQFPITSTVNTTSSLQYYYSFEPSTISNNMIINLATNTPDAVLNNATISTTMSSGLGSGCLSIDNTSLVSTSTFDNRAQYVKCPNINTQNFTKGITISLWINPSTPTIPNAYYIALCLGSSYSDNIYLGFTKELLFYGINGRDSCTLLNYCDPPTLASNTWSHVVWTISPDGNHKIYLNSTSIGTSDVNGLKYKSNYSYPFYLGYNNVGITQGLLNYYNGFLDDLRVYNRVLNSAEVQLLYSKKNVT